MIHMKVLRSGAPRVETVPVLRAEKPLGPLDRQPVPPSKLLASTAYRALSCDGAITIKDGAQALWFTSLWITKPQHTVVVSAAPSARLNRLTAPLYGTEFSSPVRVVPFDGCAHDPRSLRELRLRPGVIDR